MPHNYSMKQLVEDLNSADNEVRREAIGRYCRYLMIEGQVKVPEEALEAISCALINDSSEDVVAAAAEFLAWTAEWTESYISAGILDRLSALLCKGGSPIATAFLVRAFGFLPPEAVEGKYFDALLELTSEDVEVEVRREALEAIGHIGLVSGVQSIVDALGSPDPSVRLSAVMALGLAGYRENVEDILIDCFSTESDPVIRAATIRTFARIGTAKIEDTLKTIISDESEPDDVRVEALKAIPILYHEDFKEILIDALTEHTEVIRESAILLMIEHKQELELEGFEEMLKARTNERADEPSQASLLWALHRWRCAIEGRGSLGEFHRRFDDFLVEYAEQSLLADPNALSRRLGPAVKKVN